MGNPKVSIGLPVYNGAEYLESAVNSILSQEFKDLELIIVNNASTDRTDAICRGICEQDERVRYYCNDSNIGASVNYNRAFELARGEFFKWAAHDDECHPEMIGRCVEALEGAPDSVVMVYPLGELIDEQGGTIKSPLDRIECRQKRPHQRLAHLMSSLNMCDPIFGLYRVSSLKKTGLIGAFCGPDYVLLGELAMMGEIWEIDRVLFRLRAHAGRSMTANRDIRSRTSWYDPRAAARYFLLPVWEQMVWALLKATARADMPLRDKLLCFVAGPGVHYWRRFRNFGGSIKLRLKRGSFQSTAR